MSYLSDPEFLFSAAVIIVVVVIVYVVKRRQEDKDDPSSATRGKTILDQYSENFTQMAREGKLSPVVGRQHEIDQLVRILSRRTKNNALLLGEPGVGKTSVVERLAELIVSQQVPDTIKNKELIALDLASLVSGTKYRGELEKRLDALRNEFHSQERSVILFIDEIQQLAQVKGSEGGLGPGDILKPELARGRLQVIGATTYQDYEKYIVPEESLERRFQPIHIHEPKRAEALSILQGVKEVYENYHHVKYDDEVLEAIVDLSEKFIHKRYLPDKAIDVLDESGVRARLLHMKKKHKHNMKTEEPAVVDIDGVKEIVAEWSETPINKVK